MVAIIVSILVEVYLRGQSRNVTDNICYGDDELTIMDGEMEAGRIFGNVIVYQNSNTYV